MFLPAQLVKRFVGPVGLHVKLPSATLFPFFSNLISCSTFFCSPGRRLIPVKGPTAPIHPFKGAPIGLLVKIAALIVSMKKNNNNNSYFSLSGVWDYLQNDQ